MSHLSAALANPAKGLAIKEFTFEVFARKDSEDTLQHIGRVKAANSKIAQARAWFIYDEHSWIEMCLVDAADIIVVNHSDRDVSSIKGV